jgi:hypothetical protein
MICSECGGEFKNLGAHKRFCKKTEVNIVVDDYMEKPLSSVIAEIRQILRAFQHNITVTTVFSGGVTETVEITARFQPRR